MKNTKVCYYITGITNKETLQYLKINFLTVVFFNNVTENICVLMKMYREVIVHILPPFNMNRVQTVKCCFKIKTIKNGKKRTCDSYYNVILFNVTVHVCMIRLYAANVG